MTVDRRPSSRLLLVDAANQILLFRFTLPDRTFWATPGGGLEEGETFERAACRELLEETGLVLNDVGAQIAAREFTMPGHDGKLVYADERFFLIRVQNRALSRQGWTRLESEVITDTKWWTLQELAATTETVFPNDLIEILASVGIIQDI